MPLDLSGHATLSVAVAEVVVCSGRGEDAKRLEKEELTKLFAGICDLPDLGQFMRLTLITCFLLQTGCRVQSCVPLQWDTMKLSYETDEDDDQLRPFLSILLNPGKYQTSGTDRHVRLRRHNKLGRCAVGALALQRAYLLDVNYYSGAPPGNFWDCRAS